MWKIILMSLLVGPLAVAGPIVEGSYQGVARWKDNKGQSGSYEASTIIRDGLVTTNYKYGDQEQTTQWSFVETKDGFFKVMNGGNLIGEGHCFTVQCHYSFSMGEIRIEETLTFWQGNLYRLGSKKGFGVTIAWEEASKQKVK